MSERREANTTSSIMEKEVSLDQIIEATKLVHPRPLAFTQTAPPQRPHFIRAAPYTHCYPPSDSRPPLDYGRGPPFPNGYRRPRHYDGDDTVEMRVSQQPPKNNRYKSAPIQHIHNTYNIFIGGDVSSDIFREVFKPNDDGRPNWNQLMITEDSGRFRYRTGAAPKTLPPATCCTIESDDDDENDSLLTITENSTLPPPKKSRETADFFKVCREASRSTSTTTRSSRNSSCRKRDFLPGEIVDIDED